MTLMEQMMTLMEQSDNPMHSLEVAMFASYSSHIRAGQCWSSIGQYSHVIVVILEGMS